MVFKAQPAQASSPAPDSRRKNRFQRARSRDFQPGHVPMDVAADDGMLKLLCFHSCGLFFWLSHLLTVEFLDWLSSAAGGEGYLAGEPG